MKSNAVVVRMCRVLLGGALTVGLIGCGESDDSSSAPGDPLDHWQRLEAAIAGVRTSPDHLPAERDRIVASGDVEAAVRFVRGSFRVMPDSPDGYRYPVSARTWGAEGALRAGMGTPRDLADLLEGMLVEMGHEASVVAHRHAETRDLHAWTPPAFEPDVDPRSLGPAPGPRPPEPRPIRDADVEGVASEVLAVIPDNQIGSRLVMGDPDLLPVVQYESEEGTVLADLWGEAGGRIPIDRPRSPEPASAIPTATIRLRTFALGESAPETVVELTAGLDRLLGRQVHARFAPAVASPLDLLEVSPADIDVFLPTLFVPGEEDLVATGDPIDIAGARLTETEGGVTDGHSRIIAGVEGVEVGGVSIERIDATRFPTVEVVARVTDPDGDPLPGLPASAMALAEEGEGRRARLLSNAAAPPRVLFLVDGSSSLPEAYRGVGAGEVVRGVAEGVAERIPDARFRVALERAGEAVSATGWTDDPAELERPARAFSTTSRLWAAYADAHERYAPDVIVMTTDGVSAAFDGTPEPAPDPDVAERLRSSAPAVVLGGGDLGEAFAGIAELTGGVALDIDDQAAGIEAATAQILEAAADPEYRLRFQASASDVDLRRVALHVGDRADTASYAVPATDRPVRARQLAGLYLEIEYPTGSAPVVRTLAGLDPARLSRSDDDELGPVEAEDVRVALFGEWAVTIDGGAPSPSQRLEDLFRHRLSLRGVFEAETEEELLAGIDAVEPRTEHSHLFSSPLAGGASDRVYDLGARVWLETRRRTVREDGEFQLEAVDLLPFTRFDAVIEDPREAFEATAEASATLALVEANAFASSALDRLSGATLAYENIGDIALAARLRRAFPGYRFVAPVESPQTAAWAVDRVSGTLIPVLDDGSGGGLTVGRVESTWRTIDKGLELAGIVDGVPTSITLWAQLERVKIAKLANSTIAILTMGTDDFSPPEIPSWEDVKCEVMQSAADGAVGSVTGGTAAGEILTYIGKLNDWGEFTGFGGTGIPTSLPVCP